MPKHTFTQKSPIISNGYSGLLIRRINSIMHDDRGMMSTSMLPVLLDEYEKIIKKSGFLKQPENRTLKNRMEQIIRAVLNLQTNVSDPFFEEVISTKKGILIRAGQLDLLPNVSARKEDNPVFVIFKSVKSLEKAFEEREKASAERDKLSESAPEKKAWGSPLVALKPVSIANIQLEQKKAETPKSKKSPDGAGCETPLSTKPTEQKGRRQRRGRAPSAAKNVFKKLVTMRPSTMALFHELCQLAPETAIVGSAIWRAEKELPLTDIDMMTSLKSEFIERVVYDLNSRNYHQALASYFNGGSDLYYYFEKIDENSVFLKNEKEQKSVSFKYRLVYCFMTTDEKGKIAHSEPHDTPDECDISSHPAFSYDMIENSAESRQTKLDSRFLVLQRGHACILDYMDAYESVKKRRIELVKDLVPEWFLKNDPIQILRLLKPMLSADFTLEASLAEAYKTHAQSIMLRLDDKLRKRFQQSLPTLMAFCVDRNKIQMVVDSHAFLACLSDEAFELVKSEPDLIAQVKEMLVKSFHPALLEATKSPDFANKAPEIFNAAMQVASAKLASDQNEYLSVSNGMGPGLFQAHEPPEPSSGLYAQTP
jgi:hypothetical protein